MDNEDKNIEKTSYDKEMNKVNSEMNFFVRELQERENITKESELFRKRIDSMKEKKMERIKEEIKMRSTSVRIMAGEMEKALKSKDIEQLKAVLKDC